MTAFAWPLAAERLTRCHAEFLCHTYSTSLHRYSIHLPATRGTLAWVDSPLVVVYGNGRSCQNTCVCAYSRHRLLSAPREAFLSRAARRAAALRSLFASAKLSGSFPAPSIQSPSTQSRVRVRAQVYATVLTRTLSALAETLAREVMRARQRPVTSIRPPSRRPCSKRPNSSSCVAWTLSVCIASKRSQRERCHDQ